MKDNTLKIFSLLFHDTAFTAIPLHPQIQTWIDIALKTVMHTYPNKHENANKTISIRFLDEEESETLNVRYRHKKGPTNVLAFPDQPIPGFPSESWGDIALCVPIIVKEADQQQKPVEAHFAHLIIHGVLHLLGYNHEQEHDAQIMENLETRILIQLGYHDPYST